MNDLLSYKVTFFNSETASIIRVGLGFHRGLESFIELIVVESPITLEILASGGEGVLR
jgi:hypothetical protein